MADAEMSKFYAPDGGEEGPVAVSSPTADEQACVFGQRLLPPLLLPPR
jgi:hypothetical protein